MRFLRFAALVLLALPATLVAGPNKWTPTGPNFSNVTAAVADPHLHGSIAVASDSLIASSPDSGATWNYKLGPSSVRDMSMDAQASGTIYAATNAGIYFSYDNGESWTSRDIGLGNGSENLTAVAASPVSGGELFAVTADNRLFHSTDYAVSWMQSSITTRCIAFDPVNPSIVYTSGWMSINGGATWTPIASPTGRAIVAIYVSSSHTVFAIASANANDFEAFVSTDPTSSWTDLGFAAISVGGSLLAPSRVYFGTSSGGIIVSPDEGTTTSTINTSLDAFGMRHFTFDATDPNLGYAATGAGLLITTDGGLTWSSAPLQLNRVTSIDMNPATGILYATIDGVGVTRSSDGGANWSLPSPSTGQQYDDLATGWSSSSAVFALSNGHYSRSNDNGLTWSAPAWPLGYYVLAAAHSRSSATIYMGGLVKSIDDGDTWTAITSVPSGASWMSLSPVSDDDVYAGSGTDAYHSTNGGLTWTLLAIGSSYSWIGGVGFGGPSFSYAFLSRMGEGLYRSTDGGTTWSFSDRGIASANLGRVMASPASPATLYVPNNEWIYTAYRPDIYKSVDSGDLWKSISNGLPEGPAVTKALPDPTDQGRVYAATSGSGVYSLDQVAPVVDSIYPTTGASGSSTRVKIFGSLFMPPTEVKFGEVPAAVETESDNSITVIVPALPSGVSYDVTVTNPTSISVTFPQAFFVQLPQTSKRHLVNGGR